MDSFSSKFIEDIIAKRQNPPVDSASKYFAGEKIQCLSSADQDTIERLYSALFIDNSNTSDEDSLVEALSTLDANTYNLCKAIIFQNFMLMRRIDNLLQRIEKLEERIH